MKDVIKTIAIVILAGISIYFAYKFGTVNERMTVLNSQDSLQAIEVNRFDHAVKDLELQFIGRGKHIQEFQKDLEKLESKLNETKNELERKIDDVNFALEEYKATTGTELNSIKINLNETSDRLSTVKRETNNEIMDLKSIMQRLNRSLKTLEDDLKALDEKKMDKPVEGEKKR
ncbi:MAG: hypothetical protein JXQ65_02980 [Candidatus Marinimicrobia bacterium]|nr:hypothetical protein [Candidatus Neomarinimicrobiota bacterium]